METKLIIVQRIKNIYGRNCPSCGVVRKHITTDGDAAGCTTECYNTDRRRLDVATLRRLTEARRKMKVLVAQLKGRKRRGVARHGKTIEACEWYLNIVDESLEEVIREGLKGWDL